MTLQAAATATDTLPAWWLVAAALLWGAGYVLACAVWPFVGHGHCDGTGKRRSPGGKAWRPCKGCGGTGRKVRAGRRLWSGASRLVERGKR